MALHRLDATDWDRDVWLKFLPDSTGLPVVGAVFVVCALLLAALTASLLVALQRWGRRRRAAAIPPGGSSDRASVISGFEGGQELGRVRWQGQSWAASNLEPSHALLPGASVVVMGREGNRLQVLADRV